MFYKNKYIFQKEDFCEKSGLALPACPSLPSALATVGQVCPAGHHLCGALWRRAVLSRPGRSCGCAPSSGKPCTRAGVRTSSRWCLPALMSYSLWRSGGPGFEDRSRGAWHTSFPLPVFAQAPPRSHLLLSGLPCFIGGPGQQEGSPTSSGGSSASLPHPRGKALQLCGAPPGMCCQWGPKAKREVWAQAERDLRGGWPGLPFLIECLSSRSCLRGILGHNGIGKGPNYSPRSERDTEKDPGTGDLWPSGLGLRWGARLVGNRLTL